MWITFYISWNRQTNDEQSWNRKSSNAAAAAAAPDENVSRMSVSTMMLLFAFFVVEPKETCNDVGQFLRAHEFHVHICVDCF